MARESDRRLDFYDRVAALADAGRLTETEAGDLQRDFHRRMELLTQASTTNSGHVGDGSFSGVGGLIGLSVLGAWAIGLFQSTSRGAWILLGVLSALGVVVMFFVELARGKYRIRRRGTQMEVRSEIGAVSECLLERKCPKCGYSLLGLDAGIAAAKQRGLELGPRACPECGMKWPLVPDWMD